MKKNAIILAFFALFSAKISAQYTTDVLIVGGSASGTTAAIQSARMGVKTLLIEPTTWLGGMLTAAGVSATDGNHEMPSGLWGEFRDSLRKRYGGAEAIATGWISHTQFEPHVGAAVFKNMADREKKLTLFFNTTFLSVKKIEKSSEKYVISARKDGKNITINAKIVVDATELGDFAAAVGVPYRIGTDDPSVSGEKNYAVRKTDIIQDLTYTALLKNYGEGADKTIAQPANYTREEFSCACKVDFCENEDPDRPAGVVACEKMLTYAKLPNGYILLNWPGRYGNDFYTNVIEADEKRRQIAFDSAKQVTLRYIYYIQKELGFKHLGIADDVFPTADGFPMIPYHRESRRIEGMVKMNVLHMTDPYATLLYRTGIAVGDYPIDQHHAKNRAAPKQNFPKVPSFNVPLGALIPKNTEGVIVAEKSISVTNIVNGSTRLQPCVLGIGQAAGALAAICILEKKQPKEVAVRRVQTALLDARAYIMPFWDVKPDHPHFKAIQRVGATGILRGSGEAYLWANRTWFYPDSVANIAEIMPRLKAYGINDMPEKKDITRAELAAWIDRYKNPFDAFGVDIQGNVTVSKKKRLSKKR